MRPRVPEVSVGSAVQDLIRLPGSKERSPLAAKPAREAAIRCPPTNSVETHRSFNVAVGPIKSEKSARNSYFLNRQPVFTAYRDSKIGWQNERTDPWFGAREHALALACARSHLRSVIFLWPPAILAVRTCRPDCADEPAQNMRR